MKLNPKQIEVVLSLPGPLRYEHFIKQVTDTEEVWGLYKDGWALAAQSDGNEIFPVWPAKEYASLCAKNEWEGFEPTEFSLEDFIEELLPKLREANIIPGIFYTPENTGVTPEIDQLIYDLQEESKKY